MALAPAVAVAGLTFELAADVEPLAIDGLEPAESAVLAAARQWRVTVDAGVAGEAVECCVRALGSGAKTACCLPTPVHANRGAAFFAGVWGRLAGGGFSVLAVDWPGQGRAGGAALSAKAARHDDLLLALLEAFGAKDVCVLADAGGAAAFVGAVQKRPGVFGPHHVLLNPIVTKVSPALVPLMCRNGVDWKLVFADGWGPTDNPFTIANCGQIFGDASIMAGTWDMAQGAPRMDVLILVPPRGKNSITTAGMKPMRPEDWLHGVHVRIPTEARAAAFFMLKPSADCGSEILSYLNAQRREAVSEDLPAAPTKSAIEMGESNETVRAVLGRLSALSVFLCKSILYGVFVWARRALKTLKRRFPARAVQSLCADTPDAHPRDRRQCRGVHDRGGRQGLPAPAAAAASAGRRGAAGRVVRV
jgi:hypothetical protein